MNAAATPPSNWLFEVLLILCPLRVFSIGCRSSSFSENHHKEAGPLKRVPDGELPSDKEQASDAQDGSSGRNYTGREAIRTRAWFAEINTQRFGAAWYSTMITGDLTREGGVPGTREEVRLRGIITGTNSERAPVVPDPTSPIVLLGDSHNLVFHAGDDMHAAGAGLPDQLAFELGLSLDVVAVRGSGATPARVNLLRRAQTNPDYWSQKRLVIWCFAARELTESDGWRAVPLTP